MSVIDERRPSWCFQTHDALAAIREKYAGAKRATALAVYLALTETANRNGGAAGRENFTAGRKEISERAGVSVDTLDRYVQGFVEIGILSVARDRVGSVNLPNRWSLVDRTGAPPSRTGAATDTVGGSRTGAARTTRKELKDLKELEEVKIIEPVHDLPATVDRKPVSPVEASLAIAVLVEWNQQTGQRLTSRDWRSKIVMRIREYPSLTLDDHAHVIAASLAAPWWKGPATPSVVYGSGAQFERSILTAKAGPQDERRRTGPGGGPTTEEMRRRAERLAEEGL